MLHPVGNLPAAVYWRRRALVLMLLLSVLGGGGWIGQALLTGDRGAPVTAAAASRAPSTPPATPSLERVVPAMAAVRMPAPYGPCADASIAVRVGAPAAVPAGGRAALQLVVENTSAVPCVRVLDRKLQEIVLADAAGHRIWDSNDCADLRGSDSRTLLPGRPVSFPVAWNGRTSRPGCTGHPTPPTAGKYVLRGRLDTVVSAVTPLTVAK